MAIYLVNSISKRVMVNHQHNALMNECYKHLLKVQTENQQFSDAFNSFKTAFEEEEKRFKLGTKNPYTDSVTLLQKKRHALYSGMRQYLEIEINAGFECEAAARSLLEILNLYKVEMGKNVMGQTTAVRNMLAEMAAEALQTALTATNTMFFYTKLGTLNEEVEAELEKLRAYSRDYVNDALNQARQRMDAAFDVMANRLNSLADLFGEPFITCIKDWNSSIEAFKLSKKRSDALRKKGTLTDGTPADPNANGQANPGGNQSANPNGEGQKPQQENPPKDPNANAPADPNPAPGKDPNADAPTGGNTSGGQSGQTQGNTGQQQSPNGGSSIVTPAVPEKQKQATT